MSTTEEVCVLRQCSECGIKKYRNLLEKEKTQIHTPTDDITWKQWKNVSYKKEGVIKRKMGNKVENGPLSKLVDDYLGQLENMSTHQFNKIYQLKQFNLCLKSLRKGQVLLVHDFSQNEPQGCHWDHEQLTIHPTVAYYQGDCCDDILKEEFINLMPDKDHDESGVKLFTEKCLQHLRDKGVQNDDQCSNQYKSKNCYHISNMKIPVTKHYFSVKHGKGLSDRAGGNFKRWVKRIIKDPHRMMTTCQKLAEYSILHYTRQIKCTGEDRKEAHSVICFFIMRLYPESLPIKF